MHNTNPDYNTGKLLVSRRPKLQNKPATDYTTCLKCLKTVTKANSYKHYAVCIQAKTNGSRAYKFLGRYVEGRIHANASDTLSLVIFPVLQEDAIVHLIRYDWLLTLYGNKLCMKYTPHYQHNMIRARLRLVGRLLYAAKEINPQIEDLASLYAPEYIDTIVKAIEVVSRINRIENECGAPSSALNLVTYLKHIRKIYESELAKKNDKEGLDRVLRFKKVYKNEMPDSINKIAMENQSKIKRQKIVILPMTEDIKRLICYLKVERKRCFTILEHSFNLVEWLNGLKVVATYLLVFNRRRVGDIQNILISDLKRIECIDKKTDAEEFNLLDESGKKIAKKFFRVAIRGKKNRTVAVIADADVIKDINLIIRHRVRANVPQRNEYLFGLPNNVDDRIRVVNICKEMRSFSVACGAEKPELLRGTGLRKHVATKCMKLDLNEKALGDVMNHMGHSEKVHRDIYQQPIKSKTIVQVAKVLEAVQGPLDIDEDDDEFIDELSDYIVIPSETSEKEVDKDSNESLVDVLSCSHSVRKDDEENDLHDSDSLSDADLQINKNHSLSDVEMISSINELKKPKKIKKEPPELMGKAKKRRWPKTEQDIMFSAFGHHVQDGTFPSLEDIDELQEKHACLRDRSRKSLKTWVLNQRKALSKPKTSKIIVVNNQAVSYNLTKIVKQDFDPPQLA
ncbi:uncharacterized protein LOC123273810 [Cotesia glomerata]|nr:uncharacterized protein LOC123273810 [Cotesia glomerata]